MVTVRTVGKPGTQTRTAAAAKASNTSIRAIDAANISAGDKIILDIDSKDHGIETVTVKNLGTVAEGGGSHGDVAAAVRPLNWRLRSVQPFGQPALSASNRHGLGNK